MDQAAPPETKSRPTAESRWADVSLRTKITGVTVFILSLGLIVAGIGTQSFLRPQLIAVQDAELRQVANSPADVLGPGADTGALTGADVKNAVGRFYVAVLDLTGTISTDNSREGSSTVLPNVPEITPDWAQSHSGKPFGITASDGIEWRTIVIPMMSSQGDGLGGTLLIASSTANTNQLMNKFTLVFTGFSLAVLLLGAALTRILVTNTFAPLFEVERTALEISRGDFSKRILIASPHTEVGHLGQSLNYMLDRIDSSFDERARTIEQMRRFIGDAGHELRTPLVSVRGYAELYRMGALQDEEHVGQAMERIEKEAIRMTSLVEDLLALARLDERRPLELTELQLNRLAADTAMDTMAQDPDREVRVIEDSADPVVTGDEHKVRQVMTNLIGNALRYSPEGSPLEIAVSSDPARNTASFDIIDHGEGVPEQFREKIFDRFWRADNSRNRETGGSGLGLSIVQSIIAAHGGSVRATETPGGGATFRVELPLRVEA
ncbi:sensor histidine kinase [Leucobacter soli]|uniref:histidine kinase n=2 Tax=Leucobacter soli TaxID=2812850 RepID=A0A916NID7_9MICO|nr:HAMP domain-containing sensor histidine kinase [Leucobacter soli]CAG7620825.1 Adaptive-response sensory-kinase SasA [Leucobacter soli]